MSLGDYANLAKARLLLGLQFLSDFGDQITAALLAISILEITQSTSQVGLVYFSSTTGFIIFTLLGGYLGDRLSKRSLLVYSDMGRGALVLLLILALQQKNLSLIYFVSFLLAMLGSLHKPAKLSIWAKSIHEDKLAKYNSLSELSTQSSAVLGPLIAGFFVTLGIGYFGFAIDSLTFFLCALGFFIVLTTKNHELDLQPTPSKKRNLLDGFSTIYREAQMLRMVSYDAVQMIGFGAFNATFLVLAQRDLGWSKAQFSMHLSIIAGFTVLGAALGSTKFIAKIDQQSKLVFCALVSCVALIIMLTMGKFPLASFMFGLCDALAVMTMAVTRTKVQLIARTKYPEKIASIIAARSILIKAGTLFGAGACMIIDDYLSLLNTLMIFTIPVGLSAFSLWIKEAVPEETFLPRESTDN